MRVHRVLLLAYLVALVAYAAAQGADNGGNSGNNNVGANNGGTNGNQNLGSGNGNYNGNSNSGSNNGNVNGNSNAGSNNGNGNGYNNLGNGNGNTNGNSNTGAGNGNTNGNSNTGNQNGVSNGNNNLGSNNGGANGNNNAGSNNGAGNGNNNVGSGNGRGNGNGNAGGKGDPVMTGFAGRSFEFIGRAGGIYSLISEKYHKVSTKLKVGVMWDHNGTYMEGFGFQYRDQQIQIDLNHKDEIVVTMNGERLGMTKGETELELIPYVEGGELLLLWQLHREGLGNTVEITTDLLQITVWLTEAGTVDEGGKTQPAYLNFDVALLGPPAGNQMEGIVGETYNRMLVGEEALSNPDNSQFLPDDWQFHGKGAEEDYALQGYFGETARSMFGKEHKRVLIENDGRVVFPLHATGHGLPTRAARVATAVHASGGRKGRFL